MREPVTVTSSSWIVGRYHDAGRAIAMATATATGLRRRLCGVIILFPPQVLTTLQSCAETDARLVSSHRQILSRRPVLSPNAVQRRTSYMSRMLSSRLPVGTVRLAKARWRSPFR